jgi:hypothetical protein
VGDGVGEVTDWAINGADARIPTAIERAPANRRREPANMPFLRFSFWNREMRE